MTRILVECPECIASVRVGVLEPLQPLVDSGRSEVRFVRTMDITKKDIAWCDTFISVRGSEYVSYWAALAAKRAGKFLIYFLDDDLLNIPEGYISTKYYKNRFIQKNLIRILSISDVLWAVNRRILDKYGKWCSRTILSKVPTKLLKKADQNQTERTRVLYAGSKDHTLMIREKVSPIVKRLLNEYPERVDFTFIGVDPDLQGISGVTYYPYFDSYDDYQKKILEGGYTIGLAPGFRKPFFSCKYYNKFIEYSQYGIMGIYEDCAPYKDVVEDRENGMLCGEHAEDWYAAVKTVLDRQINVFRMVENAQKLLCSEFSSEIVLKNLIQDIPELVEYKCVEKDNVRILLPSVVWLCGFGHIQYLWCLHGIKSAVIIPVKLGKKVWKYFWRKVSGLFRV